MVGDVSTVRIPVGVLSPLHYELLTLEVVVLEAHPASDKDTETDQLMRGSLLPCWKAEDIKLIISIVIHPDFPNLKSLSFPLPAPVAHNDLSH